ncbi:hypothetical protein HZA98_03950 [Candidatus Woesearchaeota archaeon]|nr:hypothetical protein [Candidatus Woesearchaeota archaeon]
MNQFPTSRPKWGPFKYVSKKKFPAQDQFTTFEQTKGNLHILKGLSLEQRLIIPF